MQFKLSIPSRFSMLLFMCAALIASCTPDQASEEDTTSAETTSIVATSSENASETAPTETVQETAEKTSEPVVGQGFAEMSFTEDSFDFGTIKEGEVVEHTFTFRNTGTVPLVIKDATASCGCTVPQWPKEPVAPGSKGTMLVQFNSQNKSGNINKTVTIQANTKPPITTLQIKGTVNQVLDMNGPLNN